MEAPSPSSPERADAIRSGKADAVFDEGVKSWGADRAQCRHAILANRRRRCAKWKRLGFPSAMLTRKHYPKMDQDIRTVDFSGWTFFCHADLPSDSRLQHGQSGRSLLQTNPGGSFRQTADDDARVLSRRRSRPVEYSAPSGSKEILSRKRLPVNRALRLAMNNRKKE